MPREDDLPRTRESDALGTTLVGIAGLVAGVATGLVLAGLAGSLDKERVRRAMRRLRGGDPASERDPAELARDVRAILVRAPEAQGARIQVHAVGPGLLEITGSAPSAAARLALGSLARIQPGVAVVVNRVLVPDNDLPPRTPRAAE
jgi:hypothetical protein